MEEKRTQVLTAGRFGSVSNYRVRWIWFNPNDPHFLRYSFFEDFRSIRVLNITAKEATMVCREGNNTTGAAATKLALENFTLEWKITFNSNFHIYFANREDYLQWRTLLEHVRQSNLPPTSTVSTDAGFPSQAPKWFDDELAKNLKSITAAAPMSTTTTVSRDVVLPPVRLNLSLPMQFVAINLPFHMGHFKFWYQHENLTLERLKLLVMNAMHQQFHPPSSTASINLCPTCEGEMRPLCSRQQKQQHDFIMRGMDSHGFQLAPLPSQFDMGLVSKSRPTMQYYNDCVELTDDNNMEWLDNEQCELNTLLSPKKQYCLHFAPKRNFPFNNTFNLQLVGTDKEYDATSKFTVYFIKVEFAGKRWEIKRRYSMLRVLHSQLLPAITATLPSESSKTFEAELNSYLFRVAMQFPCAIPLLEILGVVSCVNNNNNISSKDPVVPLQSVSELVECGDVILFRSVNPMSGMQRNVLGCTYDHVGLVVKRHNYGYELLEATGEGVTSFPLEDRIFAYSQGFCDLIAVRKVRFERTAQCLHKLCMFTNQVEGKPYKLSISKLARGRFGEKQAEIDHLPKREYFCSELVAEALKVIGVFAQDHGKREDYFLPHYFEPSFTSLHKYVAPAIKFDDQVFVVECVRPEIQPEIKT